MGDQRTYITYQCMGQIGTLYADGVEKETGVMYSVDYYTDNPPFETAVDDIKNKIEEVKRLWKESDEKTNDESEIKDTISS